MLERARHVDRRIRQIALDRGISLIEQQAEWYGFDPIHVRPGWWRRVWQQLLPCQSPAKSVWRHSLYLRALAPDRRWLFGKEFRRRQPAGRLSDGTTLAFY
jgi:hypothetical protein